MRPSSPTSQESAPPAITGDSGLPAETAAAEPEPGAFGSWIDVLLDESTLDPRLQALLIVVAAALLARLADWIVTRLLRRLAARTPLAIDDQVVELMHRPLTRSIIVLGFALALKPLAMQPPFDIGAQRALVTIAVCLWIPFVYRSSSLILRAASQDPSHFKTIEPRTYPLFDNLAKLLFFAGFTYWIFIQVWNVNPAGFLASAGIVGLAVGFAAQDTLSNLFAGVFIIADAPYGVGDFIKLDTGERGQVLQIGLRSTRILTRDDIEITIPNSVMGAAKITNETGGPSTAHRIRVAVSVAYGSDIDVVRTVLVETAKREPAVLANPEPRVRFRVFGDSGLHFELLVWIDQPVLRGSTLDALNTAVYKSFLKEGIEIPYPKRDVYVHQVSSTEN